MMHMLSSEYEFVIETKCNTHQHTYVMIFMCMHMFVSSGKWINKKYPSPHMVGYTTICYTDDGRDTYVFPDF